MYNQDRGLNMRLFLLIALIAISPMAACMQPKDLYQRAVVSGGDGSFCVMANDVPELKGKTALVTNVSIYQWVNGAQRAVWGQSYPPANGDVPRVSSTECMKGLGDRNNPLPSLLPGERYLVDVAAGIVDRDGDMVRRWYSGYFCVVSGGGGAEIRQVAFDQRRDVWRWDICEP